MDQSPSPELPDLSLILPREMYHHLIHTLCAWLPPPVEDTPEARAFRDAAAMTQVASMAPANAHEATLAAQFVSADAQATDCIRLARKHADDTALALRCSAQAANMQRQSRGALALLLRVQATRKKREADSAALEKAAWTEHCALGLMANALNRPNAAIAAPPPSQPDPAPEPADNFASLSEADQYAVHYPRRAALIRQHGGVPPNCTFGPPEPDLAHAIATGSTQILCALDTPAEVTTLT